MLLRSAVICITLINTISSTEWDFKYTEEDFAVIRSFTNSLQIKTLVLVIDSPKLNEINFLKGDLFSVVLSSEQLNEIVKVKSSRDDFFRVAMVIVSKENLNYTGIFERLPGTHSSVWIIFKNALESLQHLYIPISTNFYIVQYTRHTVIINKAYHVKPGLNVTLEQSGVWQREDTNNINIHNTWNYNFDGATLNMLYFLKDECNSTMPILMLDRIECFQQEMLELLAVKLNYRIEKVECPERVYPYNYPNGTLSDLFVMLKRKQVDISSASYIINNERLAKYDFAWPTFTSKSMLYIKEKKQSVWEGYLRPIHKHLWQAICVWISGVALLTQIIQECQRDRFKPTLFLLTDLVKSFFTSLQVFCSQGLHDMPVWYSSRILFFLSFLLFVILYQVYSGFLISFLMIDVPNIPFNDINGFFQYGKYKMITLDRGFHDFYTNKIVNNFSADPFQFKLPPQQLPARVDEGIKKLCDSDGIMYVEFRENIVMHDLPCEIIELSKPMLYQSIGIGFPKDSPYRQLINRELISMSSGGIIQRMRKRLFSYVNLKEKETSTKGYDAVSLQHIVSIFFILGTGAAFAWGVFVLEHFLILSMKLNRFLTGFYYRARYKIRHKPLVKNITF